MGYHGFQYRCMRARRVFSLEWPPPANDCTRSDQAAFLPTGHARGCHLGNKKMWLRWDEKHIMGKGGWCSLGNNSRHGNEYVYYTYIVIVIFFVIVFVFHISNTRLLLILCPSLSSANIVKVCQLGSRRCD